ncbi:hypothetical protein RND71_044228 [Anisodus tanguticus]|uniref:Uncharacterized protein n=1 Tax=Anisodus tanguticus TaxID=243964 RepID=A0AAE1QMM7_9SOLA|nr:hypothetical protein RND71_044228 [Anisodus tanguticus]
MSMTLIEPSREICKINMRKWYMNKDNEKTNISYVLVTYWNEVVRRNALKRGTLVQLWKFRKGFQDKNIEFEVYKFKPTNIDRKVSHYKIIEFKNTSIMGKLPNLAKQIVTATRQTNFHSTESREARPNEQYPKKRKGRLHSKVEGMFKEECTPSEAALATILAVNSAIIERMENFMNSLFRAVPDSHPADDAEAIGAPSAFAANAERAEPTADQQQGQGTKRKPNTHIQIRAIEPGWAVMMPLDASGILLSKCGIEPVQQRNHRKRFSVAARVFLGFQSTTSSPKKVTARKKEGI